MRACAWLAALGTIAQAPLGLLTVRLDLDPVAVMSHFLLAVGCSRRRSSSCRGAPSRGWGRWTRSSRGGFAGQARLRRAHAGGRLHGNARDGERPARGRSRRRRPARQHRVRDRGPRPDHRRSRARAPRARLGYLRRRAPAGVTRIAYLLLGPRSPRRSSARRSGGTNCRGGSCSYTSLWQRGSGPPQSGSYRPSGDRPPRSART